jgi:hypothetical protein
MLTEEEKIKLLEYAGYEIVDMSYGDYQGYHYRVNSKWLPIVEFDFSNWNFVHQLEDKMIKEMGAEYYYTNIIKKSDNSYVIIYLTSRDEEIITGKGSTQLAATLNAILNYLSK